MLALDLNVIKIQNVLLVCVPERITQVALHTNVAKIVRQQYGSAIIVRDYQKILRAVQTTCVAKT
jgi:hypothetical protein